MPVSFLLLARPVLRNLIGKSYAGGAKMLLTVSVELRGLGLPAGGLALLSRPDSSRMQYPEKQIISNITKHWKTIPVRENQVNSNNIWVRFLQISVAELQETQDALLGRVLVARIHLVQCWNTVRSKALRYMHPSEEAGNGY